MSARLAETVQIPFLRNFRMPVERKSRKLNGTSFPCAAPTLPVTLLSTQNLVNQDIAILPVYRWRPLRAKAKLPFAAHWGEGTTSSASRSAEKKVHQTQEVDGIWVNNLEVGAALK
jgi:hypothetical protein